MYAADGGDPLDYASGCTSDFTGDFTCASAGAHVGADADSLRRGFRRRSCCASQGASDDACGCGDGLVVGRFVDALSMETLVGLNARVAAGDFAGADGVDSRWAFACALVSLRICTCRSKNGRRERRSLRM